MQTIILCGGLATRLGETAKTLPKVLLGIAGQTVLAWQKWQARNSVSLGK